MSDVLAAPKPIRIRLRTAPPEPGSFMDPCQGFDTEVVGVDEEGREYAIQGIIRVEFVARAGRTVNQAVLYCGAVDVDVAAEATIKSEPRPAPEK